MTHEAVEATIVQKFKEHYNWNDCDSIQYIYNKEPDVKEANDLINSLRFCDPAVGSGHFLVSTLNELIKAKYDLGNSYITKKMKKVEEYRKLYSTKNDKL